MSFEFIYTIVIIILMALFLIRETFESAVVVFSAMIFLLLGGVISVNEAFHGFANHGMLTVAFLFIVAAALQQTGILTEIGDALLKHDGSMSLRLLKFMTPVAAVSAFFNNTPIVAMLIPVVRQWAQKNDFSVSKFMIPLSYASILGGMCTLIGTSTTLVVHGLMIENNMEGFGFFEISQIGAPVAAIGLLALGLAGHRLLPNRKTPMVHLGEHTREFVVEMKVEENYKHIGQTIEQAGLRHLKGLYLFQIERNHNLLPSVGPDEIIQLGDRLFFTGLPDTIIELQKTPGLSILKDIAFNMKDYDSDELGVFEVVVSANSPLIGWNVRDSQFRTKYNAVILAIHRSGERIRKKIGDIVLRGGDTLLILAKKDFAKRWYHSNDFYLVSKAPSPPSKPRWYRWLALIVILFMIVAMATGLLPILAAVCFASILLVISRCISPEDARNSIDLNVLLIIASAFGISRALQNSGVAEFMANGILDTLGSYGPLGLLIGAYLVTSIYTMIITNNAAAALAFPVALSITQQASLDPHPFFIALAIAASASFATPISYQTNMMVYGPGGYKFKDFLKIGLPMNLFVGLAAITLIYFIYF